MYIPLNIRGVSGRERCLHAALDPSFCAEAPRERREPPFWLPEFVRNSPECTGDPDFRGPHAQTREPFSRSPVERTFWWGGYPWYPFSPTRRVLSLGENLAYEFVFQFSELRATPVARSWLEPPKAAQVALKGGTVGVPVRK